jgi:hypothetical protein
MAGALLSYVNDEGRVRLVDLDKIVLIKHPSQGECYLHFVNQEEMVVKGKDLVTRVIKAYVDRHNFKLRCEVAALNFHERITPDLTGG